MQEGRHERSISHLHLLHFDESGEFAAMRTQGLQVFLPRSRSPSEVGLSCDEASYTNPWCQRRALEKGEVDPIFFCICPAMSEGIVLSNFDLSVPHLGLSLSVRSHIFTSDEQTSRLTCDELNDHVQAGSLHFLPARVCHLQIMVYVDAGCMSDAHREGSMLEFLAGSICLSTLWQILGLSIENTEIRYETESEDAPNLYFEVEHPDKSSALLSPPHVKTSAIDGLVCSFNFQSMAQPDDNDNNASSQQDFNEDRSSQGRPSFQQVQQVAYQSRSNLPDDLMPIEDSGTIENLADTSNVDIARQHRQRTADLAVAALCKIIGLKTKFSGIRLDPPISPTLLELAPRVWNAHYMQATAAHSRNFSVISDIITTAGGWRPSLEQKISGFSTNVIIDKNDDAKRPNLQASVQRRLFALLNTSLDITTGMKTAMKKVDREIRELMLEDLNTQLFPVENSRLDEDALDGPFDSHSHDEGESQTFSPDLPHGCVGESSHAHIMPHRDINESYDYDCEEVHMAHDAILESRRPSRLDVIEIDGTLQAFHSDMTLHPVDWYEDQWAPEPEADAPEH
ncbi:hypothetical protein BJ170DRAFT_50817 [Xylariales sp. AK1849]|nr:hypothetical protein BJ170DRAFT_50817 [Xylariales sp. AK1849]